MGIAEKLLVNGGSIILNRNIKNIKMKNRTLFLALVILFFTALFTTSCHIPDEKTVYEQSDTLSRKAIVESGIYVKDPGSIIGKIVTPGKYGLVVKWCDNEMRFPVQADGKRFKSIWEKFKSGDTVTVYYQQGYFTRYVDDSLVEKSVIDTTYVDIH